MQTSATEAPAACAAPAASGAPEAADDVQGPEGLIAAERARIDELDARIIDLVRQRMTISETIQQARIAAGGRRLHLSREMEILDHYSQELDRPGRELAMTLLGLCRGR
ncbi:chorismate mutase [Streptomyces cacaoi]|uniref:Chorismate mutase n=1 Tax=Streptomyces cacaoi TaxID=1898 RepID=A0A4Y3QWM4_STRCI|nr:chorismate mutase [Streptomyces cacaoi]NNG88524.1 chorismate mutase [Streptomyces cacaoi]GEB48818.1 chorismate mutase [Streptomyces cacaoi]